MRGQLPDPGAGAAEKRLRGRLGMQGLGSLPRICLHCHQAWHLVVPPDHLSPGCGPMGPLRLEGDVGCTPPQGLLLALPRSLGSWFCLGWVVLRGYNDPCHPWVLFLLQVWAHWGWGRVSPVLHCLVQVDRASRARLGSGFPVPCVLAGGDCSSGTLGVAQGAVTESHMGPGEQPGSCRWGGCPGLQAQPWAVVPHR